MGFRTLLLLLLGGLVAALLAASMQATPGYMDADYYYAGALRLHAGQGASEPYIWNFLNDPHTLPVPAFAYWMPLTSYAAAAGLLVAPSLGFWAARIFLILLAALVPVLAALLSFRLTANPSQARLAGVFALFPAFYFPFLTTTDAFPIYLVLGAVFFLAAFAPGGSTDPHPPASRLFLLGLLAGLLHLARADGILWLLAALLAGGYSWWMRAGVKKLLHLAQMWAAALAGYNLIMVPWFWRNLSVWGSLFPPGGSRAVWITTYEETMAFPPSQLTLQHWLSAGWGHHLLARLDALWQNFQSSVAVQGSIVLFPFIIAGLWHLRRRPEVQLGVLMWLVTFTIMTLVFPFAGPNGSFFHSGAAVQALFWAAAPVGLTQLMARYALWRRLPGPERITRFMSILVTVVLALMTAGLYFQSVYGLKDDQSGWDARYHHYRQVEQALIEQGVEPGAAVLVNNPPGFWLASGRPAVVIPNGDETVLYGAAEQFGIRYLVLEAQNPIQLAPFYQGRASHPGYEYIGSVGDTQLYRISLPGEP